METEKVHCPECGTTVFKSSVEAAIEVADTHDERMHNGDVTAKVNGFKPPQFTDAEKAEIQQVVEALKEVEDN